MKRTLILSDFILCLLAFKHAKTIMMFGGRYDVSHSGIFCCRGPFDYMYPNASSIRILKFAIFPTFFLQAGLFQKCILWLQYQMTYFILIVILPDCFVVQNSLLAMKYSHVIEILSHWMKQSVQSGFIKT